MHPLPLGPGDQHDRREEGSLSKLMRKLRCDVFLDVLGGESADHLHHRLRSVRARGAEPLALGLEERAARRRESRLEPVPCAH